MNDNKLPKFELLAIIIGEMLVSAIVCGVFLIARKFGIDVLLGVILGSVVTIANFLVLVITTNRAIDRIMEERGESEMSEEEAAEFAAKHQSKLQAAAKISYIVRTLSLIGALVLAFIIDDVFNVLATLIPVLMLRPILTVSQLIKAKRG